MSDLADFEIDLQPGREALVKIDGKPVGAVEGVRVYQDDRNDLPIVVLEVRADKLKVSGHGGASISMGRSIDEFLDELNVDELQVEALRRGNYATPMLETFVQILKEKASGA